jgi:Tfp pilus assembly protein PilV
MKVLMPGSDMMYKKPTKKQRRYKSEEGFGLVEVLIALLIMAGSFVALTTAMPVSALMHRSALERETALSLAQFQLEFFLTNPGPFPGESGTTTNFANAADFPPNFTGAYSASSLVAGGGLTVIVVNVTPPHGSMVELSAIDTTFTNLTP